jgi:hypothetical protein
LKFTLYYFAEELFKIKIHLRKLKYLGNNVKKFKIKISVNYSYNEALSKDSTSKSILVFVYERLKVLLFKLIKPTQAQYS